MPSIRFFVIHTSILWLYSIITNCHYIERLHIVHTHLSSPRSITFSQIFWWSNYSYINSSHLSRPFWMEQKILGSIILLIWLPLKHRYKNETLTCRFRQQVKVFIKFFNQNHVENDIYFQCRIESDPIWPIHCPSSSNVANARRANLLLSTPQPLFCIGFGSGEWIKQLVVSDWWLIYDLIFCFWSVQAYLQLNSLPLDY